MRSLARLAQLAARPCCRLVVVVVLRTPPAELSDAAVRPETNDTLRSRHELGGALDSKKVASGMAHRNGILVFSSFQLVVVRWSRLFFQSPASQNLGKYWLVTDFNSPHPTLGRLWQETACTTRTSTAHPGRSCMRDRQRSAC